MANEFKISERQTPGTIKNGVALPIHGRATVRQEIDVTTEIESNVFNADTTYISLKTTIAAYYLIGTSPTAAADNTSEFLPVGIVIEEPVLAGESISVIAA